MMKFPLAISIFSFIIFGIIVSILSINFENHTVLARCPNGTHKSPSGDCEKVTNTKGMPRCPNGSHRSPDGDCEKVSGGDSSSSSKNNDKGSSKSNNNDDSSSSKGSTSEDDTSNTGDTNTLTTESNPSIQADSKTYKLVTKWGGFGKDHG